MSHTKGPWQVFGEEDGDFVVFAGEEYVTNIGSSWITPIFEDPKNEMISFDLERANANLIAAAPELLEALEAVVKNLLEYESYSTTAGDAIKVMMKAKGESNET